MATRATFWFSRFFFHGRGSELQKTPLGLFRSLLNQTLSHTPDSLTELSGEFERNCKELEEYRQIWNRSQDMLQNKLKDALLKVAKSKQVIICVDALEECGSRSARGLKDCFESVISEARSANGSLKICFSCRYYLNAGPAVTETRGTVAVEEHNEKDITTVVRARFSNMVSTKWQVLEKEIVRRSNGVFQWVILVCSLASDMDADGASIQMLQRKIGELPQDLYDLYDSLLRSPISYSYAQTVRLFQWICFAVRPLTVLEIQHASAMDPDRNVKSIEQFRKSEEYREDLDDVVKTI